MAEHSAHEPPGLPEIKDEATDTPMWVPIVGLVLLGLMALVFSYQAMTAEPAGEAPSAQEAAPEAAPSAPGAAQPE